MDAGKGRYLLNTNSKKIHDLEHKDGRCKIEGMREEYKLFFDTLQDALEYPNKNAPLAKECAICAQNRQRHGT